MLLIYFLFEGSVLEAHEIIPAHRDQKQIWSP